MTQSDPNWPLLARLLNASEPATSVEHTTTRTGQNIMRKTIALAACGLIATSAITAPAATATTTQVDPDIPNAKQVGKRYLNIICPVNVVEDQATEAFIRSYGRRVRGGTPVPHELRQAYVKAAKVSGRAGVKMNRANWPDEIQNGIDRVTESYYLAPAWYRTRNTPTVTRAWGKDYPTSGRAATHIRVALGLPPAGEGCGKYK